MNFNATGNSQVSPITTTKPSVTIHHHEGQVLHSGPAPHHVLDTPLMEGPKNFYLRNNSALNDYYKQNLN